MAALNDKIFDTLDQLFADPKVSMDKMEEFARQTIRFFEKLKDIFSSGTEEEKKQALEFAQKMQTKLEGYAHATYEKLGLNEESVQKMLNPKNFSKEDWEAFQATNEHLADFQHSLIKEHPKTEKHKKGKKDSSGPNA